MGPGDDFVPLAGTWPVDAGSAELIADANRPGAFLLAVDGVAQSYVDLVDPTVLEFGYVRWFAAVIDAAAPPPPQPSPMQPLAVLHVGGAAASLARRLAVTRPGAVQTVVEADEALARGVLERLGPVSFEYVVDDGRAVVRRTASGSVDAVVTDAFRGSRIPPEVTSLGCLTEVRRVLRAGGFCAVNVADAVPFAYARRVTATVADVFAEVLLLAEPAVLRGRRFGNLVVVGSSDPLPVPELGRALAGDASAPVRLVSGAAVRDFVAGAAVLTDEEEVESPEPPPGAFSIR